MYIYIYFVYNMIGLGWATLYATIIESYEKKLNLKLQSSQSQYYTSMDK